MPDFLKKASKRVDAVCPDDEARLAALFVRPGAGDETKRLGAPGGTLGKVAPLADKVESAGNDRSELFGQNAVLVLTDQRLLVFAHGSLSGRVRDLVGELPLGDIASMDLDAPPPGERGVATLTITFTDGGVAVVTPGSRRRRFVEAFEAATQPA